MPVTVRVEGLNRAISNINDFIQNVKDNVKNAVEESAINIEGKSKQKVPVLTGNLKRAITHNILDDGLTGEVGTYDVHYAPYVEYGTSRTPARSYLHPSLEEETPNFKNLIERAIENASR